MNLLKWVSDNEETFGADVWSLKSVIGSAADILIAPEFQEKFEAYLSSNQVKFTISISDMQE